MLDFESFSSLRLDAFFSLLIADFPIQPFKENASESGSCLTEVEKHKLEVSMKF